MSKQDQSKREAKNNKPKLTAKEKKAKKDLKRIEKQGRGNGGLVK